MVNLLLPVIYISFISLGLPDSVLGSAWPVMYPELAVPISWSGIISVTISVGTVISSLLSDRLIKKLGSGKITAISVAMTAAALLGFSISHNFILLVLWAIPYGLGAGSVDAALNNYVALHYKSRHMSWLHCMWGLGASIGPYIMSNALLRTNSWNMGYRYIGLFQVVLSAIIFLSLPVWRKKNEQDACDLGIEESNEVLSLKEIFKIKGAIPIFIAFFCYCATEHSVGLWASSYLVVIRGIEEVQATAFASLYYLGITIGRAINGFLTFKFSDTKLIHMGQSIILLGILMILLPLGNTCALIGLVAMGLGCAPIYPCIIHSTPIHFGADKSQAMIGVQMACAYVGSTIMPPIFGFVSNFLGLGIFPIYLLLILILQFFMYNKVLKLTKQN